MSPELPIFVTTFFTAFLLVFAVNLVLTDAYRRWRRVQEGKNEEQNRIDQLSEIHRKAETQRLAVIAASQSTDLGELAKEAREKSAAQKSTIKERIQLLIEQSALNITLEALISYTAICGLAVAAITFLLFPNVLAALGAALLGSAMPISYVHFKRRQRLLRLLHQLPDAFDLLARILRAGQTVTQAMQSVSQEFEAPLAYEFGYCYEQQNLGIPPETAFRDLGKRTGLLEVQIFVLSLVIHRQVGGNLSELLEKLANVVRERFRLRQKVKALTAEGRLQAIILLALPIAVWLGILFSNPTYALKLFDHPALVIGTLVSELIGALWIRKIINFDF